MGLTINLVDSGEGQFGDLRYQIADITFDSSYPTGGEALPVGNGGTPTVGGIQNVLGAFECGLGGTPATAGGVVVRYVPATGKMMAFRVTATGTISGTAAGQVFTGDALAAHRHTLHFQTSAAANAVTAAANALRTAAAAFDVAGVANSSGEGGVVDASGGTPTGTNAASAITATFTGTSAGLAEVAAAQSLTGITQRFMFFGI